MTPFALQLKPGLPIAEQIVFAAKRAIVSGAMQPGDPFPSVRALSRDAHINPNTAHKVITALMDEGLLELKPGVGTIVAAPPRASTQRARDELLASHIEPLVVEAKRLGYRRETLLEAVADRWQRLSPPSDDKPTAGDVKK